MYKEKLIKITVCNQATTASPFHRVESLITLMLVITFSITVKGQHPLDGVQMQIISRPQFPFK